ncbi:MAG: hypothetical protein KDD35_09260, partial [Bdellovibrionales bacterium]|nr:hypothetical protein [Bdellovibrionales bacterium]
MKCHLANFFPLFLMAIGWSGVGCTSTPYLEAKTFMVEREWIKSTLKDEYLDYRRLNRMKPVVSENLVVAGNAIDQIVAFDRM